MYIYVYYVYRFFRYKSTTAEIYSTTRNAKITQSRRQTHTHTHKCTDVSAFVVVVVLVNKMMELSIKRNSRFGYHPPAGAATYQTYVHTLTHTLTNACKSYYIQSARPVHAHRKETATGADSADNTNPIALLQSACKSCCPSRRTHQLRPGGGCLALPPKSPAKNTTMRLKTPQQRIGLPTKCVAISGVRANENEMI